MLNATCDAARGDCTFELAVGQSVWVGDHVLIVGRTDQVDAALAAAREPNKQLAPLSLALEMRAATGFIDIGSMQVAAHEIEALIPRDTSALVVGSAVEDGEATVVIAVAVEKEDRVGVSDTFRAWQAEEDSRWNGKSIAELLGEPEVVDRDGVVVAAFPVIVEPIKASTLWAELNDGGSLPIVRGA